MRKDKIIVYQDRRREWRWKYVARNGRVLADGAEGYKRRVDCIKGAYRVTGPITVEVTA